MDSKYFNPYTDFGFKKLFGEEGSKDLLLDFLNQLLPPHHQIASLQFKNQENLNDTTKECTAIFDIYCQFEIAEISHLKPEQYENYHKSLLEYWEVKNVKDMAFNEGKAEGKIEVAKALKLQGIDIEVIAATTGLTKDEINKLSLKKV